MRPGFWAGAAFIRERQVHARVLLPPLGSTSTTRKNWRGFGPPTAPINYRGHSKWIPEIVRVRPQMEGPRSTPWTVPTRITGAGGSWRVDYSEALAQKAELSCQYLDEASLLTDLERIEWWPMTVQEARRLQEERVLSVATAWARNDHYLGTTTTAPFGSRMDEIRRLRGLPRDQRPVGSLDARYLLVHAAAWAPAVRTAQAGGAK